MAISGIGSRGDDSYVLRKVTGFRDLKSGRREFRCVWQGNMGRREETWEPSESLPFAPALVRELLDGFQNKPIPVSESEDEDTTDDTIAQQNIHRVERILDYHVKEPGGQEIVFIKWLHFPITEASWEPISNVMDMAGLEEDIKRCKEAFSSRKRERSHGTTPPGDRVGGPSDVRHGAQETSEPSDTAEHVAKKRKRIPQPQEPISYPAGRDSGKSTPGAPSAPQTASSQSRLTTPKTKPTADAPPVSKPAPASSTASAKKPLPGFKPAQAGNKTQGPRALEVAPSDSRKPIVPSGASTAGSTPAAIEKVAQPESSEKRAERLKKMVPSVPEDLDRAVNRERPGKTVVTNKRMSASPSRGREDSHQPTGGPKLTDFSLDSPSRGDSRERAKAFGSDSRDAMTAQKKSLVTAPVDGQTDSSKRIPSVAPIPAVSGGISSVTPAPHSRQLSGQMTQSAGTYRQSDSYLQQPGQPSAGGQKATPQAGGAYYPGKAISAVRTAGSAADSVNQPNKYNNWNNIVVPNLVTDKNGSGSTLPQPLPAYPTPVPPRSDSLRAQQPLSQTWGQKPIGQQPTVSSTELLAASQQVQALSNQLYRHQQQQFQQQQFVNSMMYRQQQAQRQPVIPAQPMLQSLVQNPLQDSKQQQSQYHTNILLQNQLQSVRQAQLHDQRIGQFTKGPSPPARPLGNINAMAGSYVPHGQQQVKPLDPMAQFSSAHLPRAVPPQLPLTTPATVSNVSGLSSLTDSSRRPSPVLPATPVPPVLPSAGAIQVARAAAPVGDSSTKPVVASPKRFFPSSPPAPKVWKSSETEMKDYFYGPNGSSLYFGIRQSVLKMTHKGQDRLSTCPVSVSRTPMQPPARSNPSCFCAVSGATCPDYILRAFKELRPTLESTGIKCNLCGNPFHFPCAVSFLQYEILETKEQHRGDAKSISHPLNTSKIKQFLDKYLCPYCLLAVSDPFNPAEEVLAMKLIWTCESGFSPKALETPPAPLDVRLDFIPKAEEKDLSKKDPGRIQIRCIKLRSDFVPYPKFPQSVKFYYNLDSRRGAKMVMPDEIIAAPLQFRKRKDTNRPFNNNFMESPYPSKIVTLQATSEFSSHLDGPFLIAVCKVFAQVTDSALAREVKQHVLPPIDLCESHICHILESQAALSKAQKDDEDLQVVESMRSFCLHCPSTLMRMGTPVRSIHCKHLQCFDLDFYMSSQSRIAAYNNRWRCAVCRAPARPHELLVDSYFARILEQTAEADRTVFMEVLKNPETGQSSLHWQVTESTAADGQEEDNSDDDEIVPKNKKVVSTIADDVVKPEVNITNPPAVVPGTNTEKPAMIIVDILDDDD